MKERTNNELALRAHPEPQCLEVNRVSQYGAYGDFCVAHDGTQVVRRRESPRGGVVDHVERARAQGGGFVDTGKAAESVMPWCRCVIVNVVEDKNDRRYRVQK